MTLQGVRAAGLGPKQLETVTDFVRRHGVKVIFAEPQFPSDKLEELSRVAGVKVSRLDPLGNPQQAGYDGYLAMMRSNLKALAAALKDE
jgi:ABC-type Zn uptake system ZnuABC Zn-binding protein ZnuA